VPDHWVACHATDPSKKDLNPKWQEKYEKEVVPLENK
jgi:hypothetical protein